ncbi:MAG: hypothetical protein KIS67_26570 [Verrucomicrobiae bacterium]|nr:hypothetical protein [Verrucomicrobiae bacterium]
MKHTLWITLALAAAFTPLALRADDEARKWHFDMSLYGMAAGMSGDVTVKGIKTDLDVPFSTVLDNLEFGAFGRVRAGNGRWAVATDVIYAGLGASKGPVSGDVDQWLISPTLEYEVCKYFDAFAGARYNNISAEIRGPFGRVRSGTVDWWEPVVGGRVKVPLYKSLSFEVMGDIGGLGVEGTGLSWQVEPVLSWRFSKHASLQAGYRWIQSDFEQGSGANKFRYDVLMQGPQIGLTMHF